LRFVTRCAAGIETGCAAGMYARIPEPALRTSQAACVMILPIAQERIQNTGARPEIEDRIAVISGAMARAESNIRNMVDRFKEHMAYTQIDVDAAAGSAFSEDLSRVKGVSSVRIYPGHVRGSGR